MDSNSIYGLSHFFNPVTGQTTVSICYSQENTEEYFVLEYHDGQKFVPYDGINGIVYKDPRPVEIKYDTSSDFYNNLVTEIYIGEDRYLPADGVVYLPKYALVEKLSDIGDVELTGLTDGDALVYNEINQKWINSTIAPNVGGTINFWIGTEAQFVAITTKDPDTLYFVLDDSVLIPGAEAALPTGGTTEQALIKNTGQNYDVIWSDTVLKAKQTVNQNGGSLKFWAGTLEQYEALPVKDPNTLYFFPEPIP